MTVETYLILVAEITASVVVWPASLLICKATSGLPLWGSRECRIDIGALPPVLPRVPCGFAIPKKMPVWLAMLGSRPMRLATRSKTVNRSQQGSQRKSLLAAPATPPPLLVRLAIGRAFVGSYAARFHPRKRTSCPGVQNRSTDRRVRHQTPAPCKRLNHHLAVTVRH